MKTQKRIKKHDPRSEAAQRRLIKALKEGDVYTNRSFLNAYTVQFIDAVNGELLAIFDLRDCYRKRQPLKGIKKAFNKAIAPKRKRK